MEIREISVGELPDFVASEEYKKLHPKPITKLRAISQFKNPSARPGDIALIFAVENTTLLAFAGLLPNLASNDSAPVFSNSGWWANPESGKKMALPLFLKAFQACHRRMFFTDCSEKTKLILEKTGLFSFSPPHTGKRFFLRFYFGAMFRRKGKSKFIASLFSVGDVVLNALNSIRHQFVLKPEFLHEYTMESHAVLPAEINSFIETHSSQYFLKQNVDRLNWIVQNPWITDSATDDVSYPFSYRVENFRQEFLAVKKGKEIKALLLLSVRDNHASIPFFYFEKEVPGEIAQNIWAYLMRLKVNSLAIFQSDLVLAMEKNHPPMLFRKKISRFAGCSKELNSIFAQKKFFQDGENDVAFT